MVTRQQQLEWLAINYDEWPFSDAWVIMCPRSPMGFASRPGILITKKEWQQERDKMSSKPEIDNSWHERGELPTVGDVVEAWFDDGRECWHKADVVGYNKHENGVIAVSLIGKHERKLVWVHHFRPIRTEREKAIEEMVLAIDHIKEGNFETFIGALYDAGYRKVKP